MKKMRFFCIASIAAWLWMLGVAPVSAQVRVFLDSPKKVEAVPAQMLQAPDLEDGEVDSTGADETPGGAKIEVSPGEVFEVPVFIADGIEDVVSYSLQVLYNKKVLKIVEINGGTFVGFSDSPVTNRAAFESGKTDFTAHNTAFVNTPDSFNVAMITFQAIGRAKQRAAIRIRKTPQTDFVVLPGFDPARGVRFQRGINVVVK